MLRVFFFFFKQKTAYEMRISDWSSDVCSSDLAWRTGLPTVKPRRNSGITLGPGLSAPLRDSAIWTGQPLSAAIHVACQPSVTPVMKRSGALHVDEIGRAHV